MFRKFWENKTRLFFIIIIRTRPLDKTTHFPHSSRCSDLEFLRSFQSYTFSSFSYRTNGWATSFFQSVTWQHAKASALIRLGSEKTLLRTKRAKGTEWSCRRAVSNSREKNLLLAPTFFFSNSPYFFFCIFWTTLNESKLLVSSWNKRSVLPSNPIWRRLTDHDLETT